MMRRGGGAWFARFLMWAIRCWAATLMGGSEAVCPPNSSGQHCDFVLRSARGPRGWCQGVGLLLYGVAV